MPCKNHYKKVHYNKKFSEIFLWKKYYTKQYPVLYKKIADPVGVRG